MWPDIDTDGLVPAQRHVIDCAISDWLAAAAGLPIDFQFQSQTEADKFDGERHPHCQSNIEVWTHDSQLSSSFTLHLNLRHSDQ
jgi:hypothetical protein